MHKRLHGIKGTVWPESYIQHMTICTPASLENRIPIPSVVRGKITDYFNGVSWFFLTAQLDTTASIPGWKLPSRGKIMW